MISVLLYQIVDVFPNLNVAADKAIGKKTAEYGQSDCNDAAEEEEVATAVGANSEAAQHNDCQMPISQKVRHLKFQPTQCPSVQ